MNDINKNLPRDVFIYLLSTVTLIIATIGAGTLSFQFININIKDILSTYNTTSYYEFIRIAESALIVSFPIYVWTLWFIRRDLIKNPNKTELKIRKWLLYFTLFFPSIIIIGYLIALIYSFLQGSLTLNFGLKIASILLIAFSIIGYYLWQLHLKEIIIPLKIKLFEKITILIVLGLIIAGIIIAGSPKQQRLVRFDDQRVSDLSLIQSQITNYWQTNEKLPETLSQIEFSGFINPKDPLTDINYSYRKIGALEFELCATFSTSSTSNMDDERNAPKVPYRISEFDSWVHNKDLYCFTRTIDPKMYPSL